jgi:hypothetical protein
MKSLDIARYVLCGAVAVAMVAGCGGSQNAINVPQGAMAQVTEHEASGSWMLRNSSSSDLVYAASGKNVYVYSYPGGKQVGTLTGFSDALGACSDAKGNVWIANASPGSYLGGTLIEYTHGGTTPIATLQDQGYFVPVACSVDPSTGNLAAANSHGGGSPYPIAIWTNGEGSPTYYAPTPGLAANNPFTISYYGNGDLYWRSGRYRKGEGWLPKGGSMLMQFDVRKSAYYGWDGRYLVMNGSAKSKAGKSLMTLYTLNGANGTRSGTVELSYTSCIPSLAFWIEGSELAVLCYSANARGMAYYDYPSGGEPITTISGITATGIAISVAPSASHRRK